jgi:four helix bundle protein
MLKDFRAFQISKEFYQQCKYLRLPIHLRDQLARASSSICLNLAEASSNRTDKEKLRYFTTALGSLRECEAILDMESVTNPEIVDLAQQLGKILFKLCHLRKPTVEQSPETLD